MWFRCWSKISTNTGTWNVAADLANAFSSASLGKNHQKQDFCSSLSSLSYLRESISSPVLYHNIVCRDPDHVPIKQDITLLCYIDDNVLIESDEQEAATSLDTL